MKEKTITISKKYYNWLVAKTLITLRRKNETKI
jgi:hypothetical protein